MKRRTYAGLVTARPPKELASDDSLMSVLQEVSAAKPTLYVPQEDDAIADRARALFLYDAALTPSDMSGAYGIPSWALDTARLLRAKQFAKDRLPTIPRNRDNFDKVYDTLRKSKIGGGIWQQQAALARLDALLDTNCAEHSIRDHELNSWEDVIELAQWLAKKAECEPQSKPPEQPTGGSGKGEPEEQDYNDLDGADDINTDVDSINHEPSSEAACAGADPWYQGKPPGVKPNHPSDRYGKLENPGRPDTLTMKNLRKKGQRKRPEMEGTVPSGWHRLHLDGKIFKGAVMRGGNRGRGTILVDMSGSMSWTYEDFRQLLEVIPECSVYGYAGHHHGRSGRLVLLADRGRCATMEAVEQWKAKIGCLNVIDGPCLSFLAKMPGPRVWISDGHVTGYREHRSAYIDAVAKSLLAAGNIKQARYGEEAARLILGR